MPGTRADVVVVGAAALDGRGLVGTALASPSQLEARFGRHELGAEGLANLKWRDVFALPNPAYRHLDRFGRCVSLVSEACGLGSLDEDRRRATALVLATGYGCLQSDLDFAHSLLPGERIQPGLFPYTLPSTCLGEVAIRHRLQGPLSCLMAGRDAGGRSAATGLVEARRLVELGEAQAALVVLGDCLLPERAEEVGVEPRLAVAAVLLEPAGDVEPGILDWRELRAQARPVEWVLARLRGEARGD